MALTQISTEGIKNGTITGSDLATNVDLVDNQKLRLGTGNDLEIYHSGSGSYVSDVGTGSLYIQGENLILENTSGTNYFAGVSGAEAILYHNGTKRFETTSAGVKVTDNLKVEFGDDDDLEIYYASSVDQSIINSHKPLRFLSNGNTTIESTTGEIMVKGIPDGAVELYHDNNKKFQTTSGGVYVTGDIDAGDNSKIKLGGGDDLQIYHDGSDSFIKDTGTGDLKICASLFAVNNAANTEAMIVAAENGAVTLKYDNSTKFDTTSYGTRTTGNHTITGQLTLETDGQKAVFGAGEDLQIYHDSNVNFIDSPSHELRLRGTYVALQPNGGGAQMALGTAGGSFAIFHNGNEKLATASNGVSITGNVLFSDSGGANSGRAVFGAGSDLQIYHDSNGNNKITTSAALTIQTISGSEPIIDMAPNGAVSLYYDNSKKFETTANGVEVSAGRLDVGSVSLSGGGLALADNDKVICGSGDDLQIYHDGTNSLIRDTGNGYLKIDSNGSGIYLNKSDGESMASFITDGAVDLFYNGSKKLETNSTGVHVTGMVTCTTEFRCDDNEKFVAGTGQDLQIYHDGTYNRIESGATTLFVRSNLIEIGDNSGNKYIKCIDGGATELYHNGSKKLETTTNGIKVNDRVEFINQAIVDNVSNGNDIGIYFSSGGILPATGSGSLTNASKDLGSTSYKFRNVYATTLYGDGSNLTNLPGGGKVLQVLTATANTSSTSSGSFQSTGCSVDITPANTSNKILAFATGGMNNSGSGNGGGATIFRDSSNLAPSGDIMAGFYGEDDSNNIENCATFHVLDSPNTTSQVTYEIKLRAFSGTQHFGYRNNQRLTVIELDFS